MRYSEITETVEQDVEMSEIARKAALSVSRAIHSGRAQIVANVSIEDGEFLLYDPLQCGLSDYPDVAILLGLRKPNALDMSGEAANLESKLMDRYSRAVLVYGLDRLEDRSAKSFVNSTDFTTLFHHEFIHVQDFIRTKNSILKGSHGHDHGDERYFNDPVEFNAYTHNLASSMTWVINEFKNTPPEDRREMLGLYGLNGRFLDDLQHLTKGVDAYTIRFLRWLNDDRKKTLMKRLYRMHAEMMRLVNEAPPHPASQDMQSSV